ncbi:MAG TPA: GNAT family N-acetyltransferase [Cellvibrionaceae bacterium]
MTNTVLMITVADLIEDEIHALEIAAQELPLADRFYKGCGEKARTGKTDRVFVLKQRHLWLAAARIVRVNDALLLRNLTVLPAMRRRGLARQLMLSLLKQLQPMPVYCYALAELVGFYESLGFDRISTDSVPAAIATPFIRYQNNGKTFVLMSYNPQQGNACV